MNKTLLAVFLAISFLALTPHTTKAEEGTVELKNTAGQEARCFALSVLMESQSYKILTSCRDILYPGGTEVITYIAWATPKDGGNSVKLGFLGVGKVEFAAKKPFTEIFVTKETDPGTKSPKGAVVMRGSLQKISLLEGPAQKFEPGESTPTPSPGPKKNTLNIFRLSGAAAIIALLSVIVLVFFLIRNK